MENIKVRYIYLIILGPIFAAAILSACGTSGPATSGGWENVNGNLYKTCDGDNLVYSTTGGLAVVPNSPDC
jgi:hypothetical protein